VRSSSSPRRTAALRGGRNLGNIDWESRTIDYVDRAPTWFGTGYKRESVRPDSDECDEPRDVLFATGPPCWCAR
jgi:hypothetical protein